MILPRSNWGLIQVIPCPFLEVLLFLLFEPIEQGIWGLFTHPIFLNQIGSCVILTRPRNINGVWLVNSVKLCLTEKLLMRNLTVVCVRAHLRLAVPGVMISPDHLLHKRFSIIFVLYWNGSFQLFYLFKLEESRMVSEHWWLPLGCDWICNGRAMKVWLFDKSIFLRFPIIIAHSWAVLAKNFGIQKFLRFHYLFILCLRFESIAWFISNRWVTLLTKHWWEAIRPREVILTWTRWIVVLKETCQMRLGRGPFVVFDNLACFEGGSEVFTVRHHIFLRLFTSDEFRSRRDNGSCTFIVIWSWITPIWLIIVIISCNIKHYDIVLEWCNYYMWLLFRTLSFYSDTRTFIDSLWLFVLTHSDLTVSRVNLVQFDLWPT